MRRWSRHGLASSLNCPDILVLEFQSTGNESLFTLPRVRGWSSTSCEVKITELSSLQYSVVPTGIYFTHGTVYMSDSISLFIPPCFPPNPVSTGLSTTSVSLFLPWKQVHLYHNNNNKKKSITKLSQVTSFWRMQYLVCNGLCPLLHLFHHKTGSLPEVRNTELHIRIPENAQVVVLSYTLRARTSFYLSLAQDRLLTFYERIKINQRVAKWLVDLLKGVSYGGPSMSL